MAGFEVIIYGRFCVIAEDNVKGIARKLIDQNAAASVV
jgi:hypothetical protein